MTKPLIIDYYTDVLCVWAWIAQRRIDELQLQFGDQITLKHHYMDIFGDVPSKMATQWQSRGGYEGFAEHVRHSAENFDDAPVHPDIWKSVRPQSSANAHLLLKAVEVHYGTEAGETMALSVRKAFFLGLADVGNLDVLYQLAEKQGLDCQRLSNEIRTGAAMAALMQDYQKARQQGIKGSPSYVMDGGRQVLYGNVGYRVLQANIEELLKNPQDEASWC